MGAGLHEEQHPRFLPPHLSPEELPAHDLCSCGLRDRIHVRLLLRKCRLRFIGVNGGQLTPEGFRVQRLSFSGMGANLSCWMQQLTCRLLLDGVNQHPH